MLASFRSLTESYSQGRTQDLCNRPTAQPLWGEVLGEGQRAPVPPTIRRLERCKLPQRDTEPKTNMVTLLMEGYSQYFHAKLMFTP